MSKEQKKRVLCPACEQAWLQAVRLEPIGIQGELCGECEAFWCEGEQVAADAFTQLSQVAKRFAGTKENAPHMVMEVVYLPTN